jgi:hypothetical protein
MKKVCLLVVTVMLLCLSAFALITGGFRSLEDISSCENLLIIQVPKSYQGNPPSYEMAQPTLAYNVQVVKDLRNEHSGGEKVAVSVMQKLTPGSRYLLAGKPATRGGKPWLLFHWEIGVVEIPSTLKLSTLEKKDIPAQITAVLSARRKEIERQVRELSNEKESIDRIIPEETPNKPLPIPPVGSDLWK